MILLFCRFWREICRILPTVFFFSMIDSDEDQFSIQCQDGKILISANGYVSAFHGFYCYLKKYCGVQLSWCGNREIKLRKLTLFDGVYKKTIPQKYRVYMNYCTLDYSMAWWDFDRWEKEIDFMAMNGINMPLPSLAVKRCCMKRCLNLVLQNKRRFAALPALPSGHGS